mgnify:CR=1 FL=1
MKHKLQHYEGFNATSSIPEVIRNDTCAIKVNIEFYNYQLEDISKCVSRVPVLTATKTTSPVINFHLRNTGLCMLAQSIVGHLQNVFY